MRMMFVFLLIVNVLFAAWQNWRPLPVDTSIVEMPSHLKSIQLMRELVSIDPAGSVTSSDEPVIKSAQYLCHTLGPFTDGQVSESLKQQMQPFSKKVILRQIEENELYRYLVYMRVKNNDVLKEMTKLLVERNVSDYFIMGSGRNKRVSLGHFKEKAYADKRIQQLKALGFEAETEVIYRKYHLYWLDYDVIETEKSRIDELILPYKQNDVSLLSRDCEK